MSLVDLKERAQKRINDIQAENRQKSQQKIKELTQLHQSMKQSKEAVKQNGEEDAVMSSDGESEVEVNGAENTTEKTGDEEKKVYKNKHRLAEDKLQNKRKQKEAIKKIKMKKKQGISSSNTQQAPALKEQPKS